MGRLKIEDRRQQEEIGEDPKKEESPLTLPPPQQVQGESSQDLPKDWNEFEMSMMGEINFFLGLQIKQLKEGTFINQAKYIRDLHKSFNMEEAKTMKTPMSSSIKLGKDEKGKSIESTMYRGMIELIFSTLVRAFYSRATYGIGGLIISTVRGVEIRLDPKSIYRIFDVASVGLRVYESKIWPIVSGFEPREDVQRICGLVDA
ncbi:hypothetical protein CK203_102800 [Vitis vinifera]|uniref:Reverse transcriptase Ty1/copia-type domain-containing protein n=1 Tax=Vitis vinifera TaxID=29760 RepID=A0A438D676_VITVI|nr:hypothetical protein CK203_102800 [Vitis vinifera]